MPAPIAGPDRGRGQQGRREQPDHEPCRAAEHRAAGDVRVTVLLHVHVAARVAIHHDRPDDLVLAGVLPGLQRLEVPGRRTRIGIRTDHEHEIVTIHDSSSLGLSPSFPRTAALVGRSSAVHPGEPRRLELAYGLGAWRRQRFQGHMPSISTSSAKLSRIRTRTITPSTTTLW